MKDLELELLELQGCRFCRIAYAVKGPTYHNWQGTPLLLKDIPSDGNIGVLTGEHSSGVLAIDFDGDWAWNYWEEHIDLELPPTVTWTSGRQGRCQMAFTVPKELWPFMRTFKIVEPGISLETHGRKPEALEFRWNGVQSVLPPSMHPDTHMPYYWVVAPSEQVIEVAPLDLLEWMIAFAPPIETSIEEIPLVTIENLTLSNLEECERVLKQIKKYEPVLAYPDWIQVTWATVSHVGSDAGIALMRDNWPEQAPNEYAKLMRGYNIGRSPKFGSLVHRAAKHNTPKQTTKASTLFSKGAASSLF